MMGGETFLRSKFDYSTRQRAIYNQDYLLEFSFMANTATMMKAFKDFYYTSLNRGALSFNADWEVEGETGLKEFRFTSRYIATSLSGGSYKIQCQFEMLSPIAN